MQRNHRWVAAWAVLFMAIGGLPVSAQLETDPLVGALTKHSLQSLVTIVRLKMTGQSTTAKGTEPITISASLGDSDRDSIRIDYGQPISRTYLNTPRGAVEIINQRPLPKPQHVGAFAQLDLLSVFGIQHLALPAVRRTNEGTTSVSGRTAVQIRAVTDRTKTYLRRTLADDVTVRIDQASGLMAEIVRKQFAEGSLDISFTSGFRFLDYRNVNDVFLPFRIERVMNGTVRETITLDSIELNAALASGLFSTPRPAPKVK
jgi:hypothetical protein